MNVRAGSAWDESVTLAVARMKRSLRAPDGDAPMMFTLMRAALVADGVATAREALMAAAHRIVQ